MTPKEKAEGLVEKMKVWAPGGIKDAVSAKQCTLICCDEVLDEIMESEFFPVALDDEQIQLNYANKRKKLEYWQEVKQILEEEL